MTQIGQSDIKSARKDHVCNWCGQVIRKGDPYEYSCYSDCVFFTWKNHHFCSEFLQKVDAFDGGEGVSEDDFWTFVYEVYRDLFPKEDSRKPGREKLVVLLNHFGINHNL